MKFLFLVFLFPLFTLGQVSKKPVVYDVVHLKNGKVLFGEIIEFAQKDGDLTFKDQYNRMYSLSREMYDYFEEDKEHFNQLFHRLIAQKFLKHLTKT